MTGDHKGFRNWALYFTSGTGNAYRVCRRLARLIREGGGTVDLRPIESFAGRAVIPGQPAEILLLAMPTHGFTAPWHMIKFALRLPRGQKTPAASLATRASIRIGRWTTPGLSGSANYLISLILFLKGYRVKGILAVDMPSNWYTLHPMQSRESHRYVIDRQQKKIQRFFNRLWSGNRHWWTADNLYELLFGIALSWLSLAYLAVGRFFLAKLFFANTRCDGCGICARGCPVQAIRIRGKKKKWPFWRYNCESCMRCAAFCPQSAIEAGHSLGVILYFVTAVPAAFLLFSLKGGSIPWLDFHGSWLAILINSVYFYLALFAAYGLFWLLIRIPLVNRLFTWTTLTHIWGRYREPEVTLNDLTGIPARKEDEDGGNPTVQ